MTKFLILHGYKIIPRTVLKKFSIKEIFEPSFFEEILKLIDMGYYKNIDILNEIKIDKYYDIDTAISIIKLFDVSMLSYRELKQKLKKLVQKMPDDLDIVKSIYKLKEFEYTRGTIETEVFDKIIMESSNIDIDELKEIISSCHRGEYKNFPLIISNKNISKEKRINILKSVYVQSDMNKYMSALINVNDLEIIDDFIEAVVFKNNRVKMKEAALFKIIKYLFITNKSFGETILTDHNSYSRNLLKNKDAFIKKYLPYFQNEETATDFCNNFVNSNYYATKSFTKFINFMTSLMSGPEKLKFISSLECYSNMFNNFIGDYIKSLIEESNIQELDKTVDYIISCNNLQNIETTFEVLNQYLYHASDSCKNLCTNIRIKLAKKIPFIQIKNTSLNYSQTIRNILLRDSSIEDFLESKLIDDFEYIGFKFENCKNLGRYSNFSWVFASFGSILTKLSGYYNKDISERIIDRFYKNFEDEEFCEKLGANAMNLSSLKFTSGYYSNNNQTFDEFYINAIKDIIKESENSYINAGRIEDYLKLKQNLENVVDTISLILAV